MLEMSDLAGIYLKGYDAGMTGKPEDIPEEYSKEKEQQAWHQGWVEGDNEKDLSEG